MKHALVCFERGGYRALNKRQKWTHDFSAVIILESYLNRGIKTVFVRQADNAVTVAGLLDNKLV
ncbi:hypothetical protein KCP69_07220 [Salmonella enterica subsp. enterica]|nr:hypothetical protein KCP69_07220 [Salmonella enterica subsp. enterica]